MRETVFYNLGKTDKEVKNIKLDLKNPTYFISVIGNDYFIGSIYSKKTPDFHVSNHGVHSDLAHYRTKLDRTERKTRDEKD